MTVSQATSTHQPALSPSAVAPEPAVAVPIDTQWKDQNLGHQRPCLGAVVVALTSRANLIARRAWRRVALWHYAER